MDCQPGDLASAGLEALPNGPVLRATDGGESYNLPSPMPRDAAVMAACEVGKSDQD